MCKMNPLDSVKFVLDKKYLVNRGPNIDLKKLVESKGGVYPPSPGVNPEEDIQVLPPHE